MAASLATELHPRVLIVVSYVDATRYWLLDFRRWKTGATALQDRTDFLAPSANGKVLAYTAGERLISRIWTCGYQRWSAPWSKRGLPGAEIAMTSLHRRLRKLEAHVAVQDST
jgi:hypothetical protein